MDDWKVWLVVFIGFATALAIGVAVIAVNILSAYAARRRDRIERLSPARPIFRAAIFVRRVTFALLMLFPVFVIGAAAVLGVMNLLTAR